MPEFVLRRPDPEPASPPTLDPSQQAVLDHGTTPGAGPLLVLAGPGTGKTTTLVELVADRLAAGRVTPEQVLMLTFSRKAADDMRVRVAQRSGQTVTAMTFHAWCYALVRAHADPEDFVDPPTLVTAPEQEAIVAQLLNGHDPYSWPADLRAAVGTRGFAAELVRFMAAASSLGPDDSPAHEWRTRPEWNRAFEAAVEYGAVVDAQNLVDYPTLIERANVLLGEPRVGNAVAEGYRLIVVDEFQDTDPRQLELLRRLVSPTHEFVAVGDPDQSIYAFRGASPVGITRFSEHFGSPERPARVVPLRRTRRFGVAIRDAAVSVLGGHTAGTIAPEVLAAHRSLECDAADPGVVDVMTFGSAVAEAEHIAHTIRRRHFEDGLAWSDCAVLVRTGADLTRFQRAFVDADVPVQLAGDEIPLVSEPAVRVLLAALETAEQLARGEPPTPEQADALVGGPLAGLDASALRLAARQLRAHDPETSSRTLIARALADPEAWSDPRARQLASILRRAADMIRRRESPEQVLWQLWSGTDWPRRLRNSWDRGGHDRLCADRDLDAICALFHDAARSEERRQKRDVAGYLRDLRSQVLPADQLVNSALRPDAVQLMTAHRSKGAQWRQVFVAGVQDERWPDLRFRPSLLRPDLIAPGAPARPSARAMLNEERRLFYVAITRARDRVTISAVDDPSDDTLTPSRFVTELQATFVGDGEGKVPRPTRPLSLRHVVAAARAIGESPDSTDTQRTQAAALLARLNSEGVRGADPDSWWGGQDATQAEVPWTDPNRPVPLSGSSLSAISECSLRWFLSRKARGDASSSTAQGFGLIVHAIAEHVVVSGIHEPDADELDALVDTVWHRLEFDAPWQSQREREAARDALVRFARWHTSNPREVLEAEADFRVEFDVGADRVVVRGSMDRVELDSSGAVHVVDFKTGRSKPSGKELERHVQLAVYQRAVRHGAVEGHETAGGSELVHLRLPAGVKHPKDPTVQRQTPQSAEAFIDDVFDSAVRVMRTASLTATPTDCRHCAFTRVCPTQVPMTIGVSAGDVS